MTSNELTTDAEAERNVLNEQEAKSKKMTGGEDVENQLAHPKSKDSALVEIMQDSTSNEAKREKGEEDELVEDGDGALAAEEEQEQHKARRSSRFKKMALGLLFVAFITFVIVDSLTAKHVQAGIDSFLKWIEANPIPGFFVFMLVYFAATVLFIPGSILTLGAGFVFANAFGLGVGIVLGSLSVFLGASAGAIAAFFIGRYLLRGWVQGLTKKYAIFEALDSALEDKGFRIMALLRLSPIIPFNAINYIAGVTAISFRDYLLAMIAILPGTTVYVFLGASAGSLADSASSGSNSTVTIVVIVVGAILGIAAIVLTSYYAKKELNRVVAERNAAVLRASEEDVEH